MRYIITSLIFTLLIIGYPVRGEETIHYDVQMDWHSQTVTLNFEVDLSGSRRILPAIRYRIERELKQELPKVFRDALGPLQIDSRTLLADKVLKQSNLIAGLEKTSHQWEMTKNHLSKDLSTFFLSFKFDLTPDIIDLFIEHTYTYRNKTYLGFVPSANFTGIVIDARGSYAVHGTDRREPPVPSVFPKIFDEKMRLLYEPGMVHPEYLKRWGAVAYVEDFSDPLIEQRAGVFPLRIRCVGLFGETATDFLIKEKEALKILNRPHNIDLLSEGRVVILTDVPLTETIYRAELD